MKNVTMKKLTLFFTLMVSCSMLLLSQTANPQQYKYIFTVATDGSGDYKYIQDAIDAMRVVGVVRMEREMGGQEVWD